jgi:hypothetical protein
MLLNNSIVVEIKAKEALPPELEKSGPFVAVYFIYILYNV